MEEGAKVGEESALDGEGRVVGSKSRSGTVGVTRGRFVVRRRRIRRTALFQVSKSYDNARRNALDNFQQYDPSPPRLFRKPSPQPHFNHQLRVFDNFECP